MAIEYICKGCRHCRIDLPEDIQDGLCPHCLNKRDFPKVEKWESRDGTLHNSLEAAKSHQLMKDLRDGLSACEGRPEDQARHLLLHFDIARKSCNPTTVEHRIGHKKVLHFWSFFIGAAIATTVMLYLFR